MRDLFVFVLMMAVVVAVMLWFGFAGVLVAWAVVVGGQVFYATVRFRASQLGLTIAGLLTFVLLAQASVFVSDPVFGTQNEGEPYLIVLCMASAGTVLVWFVVWRLLLGPAIARRIIKRYRPELATLLGHGPYRSLHPAYWKRALPPPSSGVSEGSVGGDERQPPQRAMPAARLYCRSWRWGSDPFNAVIPVGHGLAAVFPRPPCPAWAASIQEWGEAEGGHVFLLRDPAGEYFAEHQYRVGGPWLVRLVVLTVDSAMSMYTELPEKEASAEDAFPGGTSPLVLNGK